MNNQRTILNQDYEIKILKDQVERANQLLKDTEKNIGEKEKNAS